MGNQYRKLGQLDRAGECLSQALAIFEEIQSPHADKARRQLAEFKGEAGQEISLE
jgi:hypothetical protein